MSSAAFILAEKEPKDVNTYKVKAFNYDDRYYSHDGDFLGGLVVPFPTPSYGTGYTSGDITGTGGNPSPGPTDPGSGDPTGNPDDGSNNVQTAIRYVSTKDDGSAETVLHNLGKIPKDANVLFVNSFGSYCFDDPKWDATNLYIKFSASGLTCDIIITL